MEPKTKIKVNGNNNDWIHAYASALVGRAVLAGRMGTQSYGGARDLFQALGYPETIKFDDYYARYKRQEIAKAIIDRPVTATWQGPLELVESNKPKDTEFEKAWLKLNRTVGLKTRLARVDRLTGIGQYGVLLLGLNDTSSTEDLVKPVRTGKAHELMYVKPFSEGTAVIASWVENTKDPRYGQPLLYDIQIIDPATKAMGVVKVHFSRVIHITDGTLESEVYGTPRMEAVFNRLMDIEKLAGGDAEMFWRGARPGYHGKIDPEFTMTEETKKDLKDQVDEWEHNLRRILVNEGMDIESFAQQIADPSNHMETQLKLISAETGIPVRILSGSERGELASSEDRSEWLSYVQTRREEHAEPRILRLVVDRFIELGVLPEPANDYQVKWADLFAQSEKARVEIGKSRANAIREYTSNPMAMEILPPSAFMEIGLGLTYDQIELVHAIRDSEMETEIRRMRDMEDILNPPAPEPEKPEERTLEERGDSKKRRRLPNASV